MSDPETEITKNIIGVRPGTEDLGINNSIHVRGRWKKQSPTYFDKNLGLSHHFDNFTNI